jgi:hypothetical protein
MGTAHQRIARVTGDMPVGVTWLPRLAAANAAGACIWLRTASIRQSCTMHSPDLVHCIDVEWYGSCSDPTPRRSPVTQMQLYGYGLAFAGVMYYNMR